jgi:hypothetical protein
MERSAVNNMYGGYFGAWMNNQCRSQNPKTATVSGC